MDGSAFSRIEFGGIWWLFFFALIGIVALVSGSVWLVVTLLHHLRWVS